MAHRDDERPFKEKYRIYIYPVVLAVIMTMFIRPIISDGEAMSPTIGDNQLIIVSNEKYSANRGTPEFQQVVAFREDFIQEGDKGDNTIRRVIGLPGDKIEIKGGKVYRNGKVLKEKYIKGKTLGEVEPITVGKDEVFVLSDNRTEGLDSRDKKVGPLKMNLIRGSCSLIVWPISCFGAVN